MGGKPHDGAHRIDHSVVEPHGRTGDGAPCAARRRCPCHAAAHDRRPQRAARCADAARSRRDRDARRRALRRHGVSLHRQFDVGRRGRRGEAARCALAIGRRARNHDGDGDPGGVRRAWRAACRAADAVQRRDHRGGSRVSARRGLRGAARARVLRSRAATNIARRRRSSGATAPSKRRGPTPMSIS